MVLKTADKNKTVNIKLIIEYDGKNYFGWQRQNKQPGKPGMPTIQQTIEESLQVLFRDKKIKLTGAGRTDTGVHALGQAAHFRLSGALLSKALGSRALLSIDLFKKPDFHKLVYRLNSILPKDITIKKVQKAADDFHARYSAKKRVYRYKITLEKRSYELDKYYHFKGKFDIEKAKEFCKAIEGVHSFKTFCKNKDDKHGFQSNVFYAKLKKKKDNSIEFEICANRFLHSMVRAIVGMMLNVASSKTSIKEFKEKFIKGENIRIQFVPANALILAKIIY
jgi:tRNA pseudouridine38-40 synthase